MRTFTWLIAAGLAASTTGCVETMDQAPPQAYYGGGYDQAAFYQPSYEQPAYYRQLAPTPYYAETRSAPGGFQQAQRQQPQVQQSQGQPSAHSHNTGPQSAAATPVQHQPTASNGQQQSNHRRGSDPDGDSAHPDRRG